MSEEQLKPLAFDDNQEITPISFNTDNTQNENEFLRIEDMDSQDIAEKNTNFILFFGSPYSGKSVILTSILYFLNAKAGHLKPNKSSINSNEAQVLIATLLESISQGILPERTSVDKVTEIDFTFVPNNKSKKVPPINLTFLETAGDNNNQIRRGGKFHRSIENYFSSNIPMSILLVTSYENAHKEDAFIVEFLNKIEEVGNLKNVKILLIISKWDLSGKTNVAGEAELNRFIQQNLPMTSNALNTYKMDKTFFTIGNVENQKITKLSLERAKTISNWLYKSVTGKSLDYEGTFWEQIKFSINI